MRILVTGASGQLGAALRPVLAGRHEVLWTDLEDLDVRDLPAVRDLCARQRPNAVLHLAAATQVDACERRPEMTFEINALGTRYVALAAREVDAELLLISTDYVFDGLQQRPYWDYDEPRPCNVYGASKLYGERAVASLVSRHYIVRTAGLFAPGGNNFVATILTALGRQGELRVVDDQVCRPTYAPHLAQAVGRIIGSGNYGIFHVCSAQETSWYDFARRIVELAGQDPAAVAPISSGELNRPAARPPYSVLDTRAYELTFGHILPVWEEGLEAFLAHADGEGRP